MFYGIGGSYYNNMILFISIKGSLHCILAINLLLEHSFRSTQWIVNLEEKVVNGKLSDEEQRLLWEQKLMFHLISTLVPKNSKDGFYDDPYHGRQVKKILSIAHNLLPIFEENFINLKFSKELLKLLSLFESLRKSMLCKKLEVGWESDLKAFMDALTIFMAKSDSIGLINFHALNHSRNICKKFNVGLGAMGCDSTIESYHAVIMTDIAPHLGKAPTKLDNAKAYDKENMPPDHMVKYYENLFSRALEISLFGLDPKDINLNHYDYSKNITLDAEFISQFIKELHLKPKHFSAKKKSAKFDENIQKVLSNPCT